MTATSDPPSTSGASFYFAGGTLSPSAPSYVERQADRDLLTALRVGEYCYVLNSRQMGKSSLCVRAIVRLREEGVRTAFLDLTKFGGRNLTAEQWYAALVAELGREIGLRAECLQYWKEHLEMPPVQRLFGAIREVALEAGVRRQASGVSNDEMTELFSVRDGPVGTDASRLTPDASRLVVFIDEIDITRSLPFNTDEFFAAIRQCYVGRATEPALQGVTFCLLGTATPAELIEDTRISPFNIGRRIEVRDFTPEEAAPLARGLVLRGDTEAHDPDSFNKDAQDRQDGNRAGKRLLERILYWTGGHPYLTQRLCRAVAEARAATPRSVDELCAALFLTHTAREGDDNLALVRNRLLKSEADLASLLDLYGKLRMGKGVADDETNALCGVLKLSGVAKAERGRLVVRNRIYEKVFDREWVAQHMPDAELRRQKAAYRRGLARAATIAGAVLAVVGALAATAVRQTAVAREALWDREQANASLRVSLGKEQAEKARADGEARQKSALAQQRAKALQDALVEKKRADHQTLLARQNAADARMQAEIAGWNARRAEENSRRAHTAENLASISARDKGRQLYSSEMHLAQQACVAADGPHAQEFLVAARPEPGKEDLRDFVWRYLWRLSRRDDALCILDTGYNHGSIDDVAFSPDGRMLVSTGFRHFVTLWDMASRRKIGNLDGVDVESPGLAFSPDGSILATGRRDNTIRLWDVSSRRSVASLPNQLGERGTLAFSPGGRLLAAIAQDRAVKLWDARTHKELLTVLGPKPGAGCLAFSPDGHLLAIAGRDYPLRLWDVTLRREVARREDREGAIGCVAFSPDGETVAMGGSQTGKVKLWNWRSGRPAPTLMGHRGGRVVVAFSPDGRWLATGGMDYTVRLWNTATGEEVATLRGHRGGVGSVAFSPDGSLLASAGWPPDDAIRLWRVPPGEGDFLKGHESGLGAVTYSPDGKTLISGDRDGSVKLWEAATGREVATLRGKAESVVALAVVPGGKLLAVGIQGMTIGLWDLTARREVAAIQREGSDPAKIGSLPSPVAFSPNGRILAFSSDPNTVRLWDVAMRQEIAALKGRPLTELGERINVKALAFSPDGKTLAAGAETSVTLWDVASRRPIAGTRGGHDRAVSAVAYSADGKLLVTGGVEGDVKVWDVASRREVVTLKGHTGTVRWVGFAPDGKSIASSSVDGTLRFWNTTSWLETATLQDPLLTTWQTAAFSPDGDSLAVGRVDSTIRLLRATPFPEADHQMMLAWHRQSAEEARQAQRWAAVIEHLSPVIAAEPEEAKLRGMRSFAYLKAGQWREAAADFARLTELQPDDPDAWYCHALCASASGDTAGYRMVCANMLRHFASQSDDPSIANGAAWTCVIAPGAVSDPAIPARWAERARAARPKEARILNTLGAALYRAGRFEEAIQRLSEPVAVSRNGEGGVDDWLFLAMAHARLGHVEEARRWLNKAERWIDQALHRQPSDPGSPPLNWDRRLTFQLLRKEAAAVVK